MLPCQHSFSLHSRVQSALKCTDFPVFVLLVCLLDLSCQLFFIFENISVQYRFSNFCLLVVFSPFFSHASHYPSSDLCQQFIIFEKRCFLDSRTSQNISAQMYRFPVSVLLVCLFLSCLSLPLFRPLPAIYHFRKIFRLERSGGFWFFTASWILGGIFRTDFPCLAGMLTLLLDLSCPHCPSSDLCQQFIIFENISSNVVEVFRFFTASWYFLFFFSFSFFFSVFFFSVFFLSSSPCSF